MTLTVPGGHEEPDLRPCGRFEWERVVRRAVLPIRTKLLALVLSTYADPNGSRVRPGQGVLRAVTGFGERSVRRELEVLRELGLIEQTARGGGRGRSGHTASYRLTLPTDLLDRLTLLTPTEVSPATQVTGQSTDSPATREPGQSHPQDVDNSDSPAPQETGQSTDVPCGQTESPAGAGAGENDFHRPNNAVPHGLTGQTGAIDRPRRGPDYHPTTTNHQDQPPPGLPTQPPTAREPRTRQGPPQPRWAPGPPDRRTEALDALLTFTPTTRRPPPPTEDPPT